MSEDKMSVKVWSNEKSPHSRAVRMAIELLKINEETIQVLTEKEKEVKGLFKINPEGMVPTIEYGNLRLWQSRAIMIYLCSLSKEPIAKELYPEDPKIRAKVDQFLYFDACNINPTWGDYAKPIINKGETGNEKALEKYIANLKILDKHLQRQDYVVSDKMTLADLSLGASISTYEVVDLDLSKHEVPNVLAWLVRLHSHKVFKSKNNPGVQTLKKEVQSGESSKPSAQ